jgi:uncharacterized repeat protein (TIGR01451 family)
MKINVSLALSAFLILCFAVAASAQGGNESNQSNVTPTATVNVTPTPTENVTPTSTINATPTPLGPTPTTAPDTGAVKILTDPPELNASIYIDGVKVGNGMYSNDDLPAKTYFISFGDVKGYVRPKSRSVTITKSETAMYIIGEYMLLTSTPKPSVCTPTQVQCLNSTLQVCSDVGTWITIKICDYQCDPVTRECITPTPTATPVIPTPSITLTKTVKSISGEDTAYINEGLTITVKATNTGAAKALNMTINDTVPACAVIKSGNTEWSGELSPDDGEVVTIYYDVEVTRQGTCIFKSARAVYKDSNGTTYTKSSGEKEVIVIVKGFDLDSLTKPIIAIGGSIAALMTIVTLVRNFQKKVAVRKKEEEKKEEKK